MSPLLISVFVPLRKPENSLVFRLTHFSYLKLSGQFWSQQSGELSLHVCVCVQVLLAAGRKASTGDIGLECVGVKCSQEWAQSVHNHLASVCGQQLLLNRGEHWSVLCLQHWQDSGESAGWDQRRSYLCHRISAAWTSLHYRPLSACWDTAGPSPLQRRQYLGTELTVDVLI